MNDKQIVVELAIVLKAISFELVDSSIAAACSNVLRRCCLYDSLPINGVGLVRASIDLTRQVEDNWDELDLISERWSVPLDKDDEHSEKRDGGVR